MKIGIGNHIKNKYAEVNVPKACGTRIKTRVILFPSNTGNTILLVVCFPFIFNVQTLHIVKMH